MKHVRMFVIILLVSAVATVYGKERHGTETGTAQLSIYKLPPLERAIRCTKYYEGWHGEKKHWPYVGWGHKVLPGESFTNDITKAQGDSILRADMMKLCRLFSRFGRDSTLLSEISDNSSESFPNCWNIAQNFRRSFRRSASACRFVMVRAEYLSPGCNRCPYPTYG